MKRKIPQKVQEIRDYKLKQEAGSKNISFSQLSTYLNCPKCWERSYLRKEMVYKPSIHATFGTAVHETLQTWLDILYNDSVKASNELDINDLLLQNLKKCYASTKAQNGGVEFSSSKELQSFYEDGVAILDYVKKKRVATFPDRKVSWLVGCEIPLYVKLHEKFYFKGYIDVLTYEEDRDIWKIWDIKTSTSGWKDEKTDFVKTSQVILYKEFLHRMFDIPLEKIEIEYFIVKRKVLEEAEFASMKKRVQEFTPTCGSRNHKKAVEQISKFCSETLNEQGGYIDKSYTANPSQKNCKWCPYKETCAPSASVL